MANVRMKTALRGIATLLGLRNQGFFIPYKHAAGVPAQPPAYQPFEDQFAASWPAMQSVLEAVRADVPALRAAAEGPLAGHWDGGYFAVLDAAATWAMVRTHRPARIVEVGSGTSTHVMCAAAADLDPVPVITCIDPVPRSEISALGITWHEGILRPDDLALFAVLEPGDIAFFDSSHVLFQGTDVDIIYNRVIPMLKPGVIVHIHDIMLPDPYPEAWAHRAYTEQLALSGWLLAGGCETLFSSYYAATRKGADVENALSGLSGRLLGGGSLWFRR